MVVAVVNVLSGGNFGGHTDSTAWQPLHDPEGETIVTPIILKDICNSDFFFALTQIGNQYQPHAPFVDNVLRLRSTSLYIYCISLCETLCETCSDECWKSSSIKDDYFGKGALIDIDDHLLEISIQLWDRVLVRQVWYFNLHCYSKCTQMSKASKDWQN